MVLTLEQVQVKDLDQAGDTKTREMRSQETEYDEYVEYNSV